MTRIILTHGLISGVVIILGMISTIMIADQRGGHSPVWLGYLIMLVALSAILVGVKQHRDQALGGVIKFRTALLMGLGIAMLASLAYVTIWEVYLAITDYAFMPEYTAKTQRQNARRA